MQYSDLADQLALPYLRPDGGGGGGDVAAYWALIGFLTWLFGGTGLPLVSAWGLCICLALNVPREHRRWVALPLLLAVLPNGRWLPVIWAGAAVVRYWPRC